MIGTMIPTARNLWMGGADSVSSLHFDFYENILCVLYGHKNITLYPPSDLPYLYVSPYIYIYSHTYIYIYIYITYPITSRNITSPSLIYPPIHTYPRNTHA